MTSLLQQWVMQQAERRPEATALMMAGDRLTYGQLDALSNQLARTLRAAGCERGDRVCFLLPKSPLAIVRSEEHTSELQSQSNLVCRLLLEKKKKKNSAKPHKISPADFT